MATPELMHAMELSNSPQVAASKTQVGELTRVTEDDPTATFASKIRGIIYEAPAFENAEQLRAAFEEADKGAHEAAKKKFRAEADIILYVAQVQSYLSERGANAHLRRAAGLKTGFQEWYEAFRAEYDLEYAFKTMQHKIAELRGGCSKCGRLNDNHKQSCVLYRKLIDRAEPGKKDGPGNGNRLDTKAAVNAHYADRYHVMSATLANLPLDADPGQAMQTLAALQVEAQSAHADLDPELAKKIKIPKLVELPKPDPEGDRYRETLLRIGWNYRNHINALANQLAGMVIGKQSNDETVKLAKNIVELYQQSLRPGFFEEKAKLQMHPVIVGKGNGKPKTKTKSQPGPVEAPASQEPPASRRKANAQESTAAVPEREADEESARKFAPDAFEPQPDQPATVTKVGDRSEPTAHGYCYEFIRDSKPYAVRDTNNPHVGILCKFKNKTEAERYINEREREAAAATSTTTSS